MNLKFSVLMSVYFKEQPKYLDLSLKSIVEDQILKPNEIILVKDGPLTKGLDEVIDKYVLKYNKLFKIISLKKNLGLGKALNIGLQQCKYDLVARMDTDDISKPERFKEEIEAFKTNPKLDIIGSWIDEFSESENKIIIKRRREVPETSQEIYDKLKKVCAFNHPTVMYKKSKVLEFGGYSQEFFLEDYYLWVRLAINGCLMYNIQKSLLYFRTNEETYRRRGGIILLKNDLVFQYKLYQLNFINMIELIINSLKYSIYRILPNKIREILQKKLYRDNIKN